MKRERAGMLTDREIHAFGQPVHAGLGAILGLILADGIFIFLYKGDSSFALGRFLFVTVSDRKNRRVHVIGCGRDVEGRTFLPDVWR